MTVNYRNKTVKNVGTTPVVVCTVPEGMQYLVAGLTLANIVGATVFADITLSSAEDNHEVYIIKRGKIPVSMTMVPVANETTLTLEAGDQLKIKSSTANSIDVVLTYMSLDP